MRVLMVGDVVGKPGRRAVQTVLPELRRQQDVDFVIANAENAAGGRGVTLETANDLLQAGVDVITTGNHVWDNREIISYLDGELPITRPLNYPPGVPGRGYIIKNGVMVINLMGRVFMGACDCPFQAVDRLLGERTDRAPVVIVDMHAEATSEKCAMGWHLNGRVSAVLGTHTHVGTVDAKVLPKGTAYVTDIGMVGPINSIIGDEVADVLYRFLTSMPNRLSVASGPVLFSSVLVEIDEKSGKALAITRMNREVA
jgi:metallophosphoesterase (TIGR00282 family)